MTSPAPRAPVGELVGTLVLAAFTSLALVATGLAWLGRFDLAIVLPASLVATLLLAVMAGPHEVPRTWPRPHPASLIAAGVIVAVTALNLASAGEHVMTDRDPGVTVVAARSLAGTGTTDIAGARGTPFGDVVGVTPNTAIGYEPTPDGSGAAVLIQSPGVPALLATAQAAAGDAAMFLVVPLLAGIAMALFSALAMRVAGPWFGLLATAALAVSLVQAYVARDAMAEVPTQVLILGGLWLLLVAQRDGHLGRGALAGLAVGVAVALHLPALLAVAALVLAAAFDALLGDGGPEALASRRAFAGAVGGMLAGTAFGLLGMFRWNRAYIDAHDEFVAPMLLLLGLALAAWATISLLRRSRPESPLGARARLLLGRGACVVVATAGTYALLVRPHVERARVPAWMEAGVGNLQRATGTRIEPTRSYAEHTMQWLADYVGIVALVLGIAGIAWGCVVAMRPAAIAIRTVLPLAMIATAVYVARPTAFPDQPWVMRRFAPEVVPLLLVFGAWLLSRLWAHQQATVSRRAGVGRAAIALAAALMVVLPAAALQPVARAETGTRQQDAVHALCANLGPDAAVLMVGGLPASAWYPQTVRSFCGVPVATLDGVAPGTVARLSAEWRRRGRDLRLVGRTAADLAPQGVVAAAVTTIVVGGAHEIRFTINRRPDAYAAGALLFATAPAP